MIKNYFFVVLLFVSYLLSAQDVVWVNDSCTTTDNITPRQSDTYNENIFVMGNFSSNATFGTTNFLSYGSKDIFIEKINPEGMMLKIVQIGGANADYVSDIKVSSDGFVYAMGSFSADINIDGNTLVNTGSTDGFLAKYDLDLNLIWVENIFYGSADDKQYGKNLGFDSDGNLIISGYFQNEIIFNNSTNPDTLTSSYTSTAFVSKFDINGNYISSLLFNGNNKSNYITDMKVVNDNIYFVNKFKGEFYYYNDTVVSAGNYDGIVMKVDIDYNFQWIRKIQGTNYENLATLEVDGNEDLYIAGYYKSDDLEVDSTSTLISDITPVNNGGYDWILLSYNSEGELQWSKYTGSSENDALYNSSFANEIFFVSGYCKGDVYLDNDTIKNSVTGGADAVYLKIMTDGTLVDYKMVNGLENEYGLTVANYKNNLNTTFITTGTFNSDTVFVGKDTLVNSDVDDNKTDMFVVKYGCDPYIYPALSVIDSVSCPAENDGRLSVFMTINGTDTVDNNWSYKWSNGAVTDTNIDLSTGWYRLLATSGNGCAYEDSIYLTNKAILKVYLEDADTLNCFYDTLATDTVFANLGRMPYTYTWANTVGSSVDSIAYNLPVGKHYVTVTDACGTRIVDSVRIEHVPTLTSKISTHNTIIACKEGKDGEAWMNTDNGYGEITYIWENSASTDYVASDLAIGLHHVTVADGCISIVDSVNVVNLPSMNANIDEYTPVTCKGNTDAKAHVFVVGGVQPYTYLWSSGETTESSSGLSEGKAYVTVTDACLTVVDSVEITVQPALTIQLGTKEACPGEGGEVYVVADKGSGTYTYAWDTVSTSGLIISTNDTVKNLASRIYYVTVTDACGSSSDSISLRNLGAILIRANVTNESNTEEKDGSISLDVSGGMSPYLFNWSNDETGQDLVNLSGGTYTVTVSDYNNCSLTDSFEVNTEVQKLEIMDAFTPNGDGVNETWTIKNINNYPTCKITIFNQWGNLLYESTGYDEPWDGTNNGKLLPAAVYYYILDLKDGTPILTGSITLIR